MNVKEWRETHNLSQSKLAELLPVKIRTLQDWESASPKGKPPAYLERALESLARELSTENQESDKEETKGEPRDSVEANIYSVLSLGTLERIDLLITEHGYSSREAVIDSAVETLYTLVTNERKPPASVKKRIQGPTGEKFQSGDLCSDKGMGAICRTTLHPQKHHPDCPKFPN